MIVTLRSLASGVALGALGAVEPLHAQPGVGTWVKAATASGPGMTMTVETCCNGGRRLIYRVDLNGTEVLLTVEAPFDGTEAPVLIAGKPSGETIAIRRVDDHHFSAILKTNGKPFATSNATLSADGRTLTVINDIADSAGGRAIGKTTEIWVRK